MLPWQDLERERSRRLLGAAGIALALHVLLALLPLAFFLPDLPRARSGPTPPGSAALGAFLGGALQGAEVTLRAPPPAPAMSQPVFVPAASPRAVEIEPAVPVSATSSPAVPPEAASPAAGGGSGAGGDGPGESGTGNSGDGSDEGSELPAEVALRPRVYVQPRIPEDIVRKRRIDDYVLLQVLVDTTGSVRDVRVLRTIADCAECTQSAVDTARRYRYEPVLVNGRAVEVWTVPFTLRFSYRR